jgi:hypothetical protein
MNRMTFLFVSALIAATACAMPALAQAPAPAAVSHGAFPAKLNKTLDSSKLKDGDAVEAETTGSFKLADGTLVPKGSKLIGHVTTAKARSKGDPESQLTVSFDKLNVLNGKALMLKGTIKAVFPPAEEQDPGMPVSTMAKGGAPGAVGGTTAPASLPTPGYQPTDIKTGSNTSGGRVDLAADPKSVGVHDVGDLSLEDGVLRSKGKNVKLGGGVRVIVQVDILG